MDKKHIIKEKLLINFLMALDKAYGSWSYLAGRSFVAGIFVGLGATVGFALVIVIIGYIFNVLEVIPIIGDFFTQLNEFIISATPNVISLK